MFRPCSQLLTSPRWLSRGHAGRGLRLLALTCGLWAMGCQPKIGDECETAIDCSTLGDRLCDTSQPEGYCTVFNCEPDTCEDEAVCVAFDTELDPACEQADDGRYGRFGRTFCMRKCDDDGDCRDQYRCVLPDDLSSFVVDTETDEDRPQLQKFCIADDSAEPEPDSSANPGIPQACFPNDPHDLPPPYDGAGGMGGAAGMGGAGMGGAGVGGAGVGGAGTGGAMGGGSGMGGSSAGGSGGA